jgi:biopolymer transport protein ExbB
VATIGPLLGLFGTVLGMIELFRAMAASGARPEFSDVVGGIWTALLTTAAGLVAAIPAQAAHHWFDHIADRRARSLQEHSGRLELS